jgi:hypothetical protein
MKNIFFGFLMSGIIPYMRHDGFGGLGECEGVDIPKMTVNLVVVVELPLPKVSLTIATGGEGREGGGGLATYFGNIALCLGRN